MKILAMDTTAVTVTAALCEDDRTLGLYTLNPEKSQSELLLPMIDSLLGSFALGPEDIDLFAVTCGPGSFTGVRIGVSLVKGMAYGGAPCAPVSTLEALAENLAGIDGLVVPVMDARRSQLYTAIFADGQRLTPDLLIPAAELEEMLRAYDRPICFVGDGCRLAYSAIAHPRKRETPPAARLINAASVAAVGLRMAQRGETVPAQTLAPVYLRASQAERERSERLAREKADAASQE